MSYSMKSPMAALLIASAVETAVAVSVFPQYLPKATLSYVFTRLFALQFAVFALYAAVIYPFFFSPLRHLPGPKIGTFAITLSLLESPSGAKFLDWMEKMPNDGIIYFRGLFFRNRLLLTDPKALGEVLVTKTYDFEKPTSIRNFLRTLLGDGLIIVEGDDHKFLRKNVMPVFSFRHIKDLYSIFWDKSAQLSLSVAQQVAENPESTTSDSKGPTSVVEINHWANQVTMDIIGMAALGRDFQALKNNDDPLVQNYEALLEPTAERKLYFVMNLMLPMAFVKALPWHLNKLHYSIAESLTNITLKLVREKKEMLKQESDSHKDLLSLLLRSNNFSDKQLSDQLLTFLAAGHETTSSAFTWMTYLLCKNPEIQTALREEIHAHVPSPDKPVPADFDLSATLESLPILNGVCNETLRLYPTVPVTVRNCVRDSSLLGWPVPVGTEILISPWAINRNSKLWGPDALKFIPDRWIDTDPKTGERRPNNSGGASSNYCQLTFLHGPRSCIGQGFAKAELRCLVAAFIGSFDISMADPNEVVIPHGVVTIKPQHGMHLRLRSLGPW